MKTTPVLPTLRHFKVSEFACNHCGELPQDKLMLLVDQIRHDFGKPIVVTSGKRCLIHNKAIGGAKSSRHVVGDACDLSYTPELLAFILGRMGHYGICVEDHGATPTWIHVDMLQRGSWRVFKP